MRPYSLVISLLLLSLFLTKAQGIRLEKGFFSAKQHKQHDQEESNLLKKNNSGDANKEAIFCKEEQYCTGKIKIRKLVTLSTSTTHDLDISKNVKNGGNNEAKATETGNSRKFKVNKHYLDLVVVDLDYSPPKRKPPIHN